MTCVKYLLYFYLIVSFILTVESIANYPKDQNQIREEDRRGAPKLETISPTTSTGAKLEPKKRGLQLANTYRSPGAFIRPSIAIAYDSKEPSAQASGYGLDQHRPTYNILEKPHYPDLGSKGGYPGGFGSKGGYHGDLGSKGGYPGNLGSRGGYPGDLGSKGGYLGDLGSKGGYPVDLGSKVGYPGGLGFKGGYPGDLGSKGGYPGDFGSKGGYPGFYGSGSYPSEYGGGYGHSGGSIFEHTGGGLEYPVISSGHGSEVGHQGGGFKSPFSLKGLLLPLAGIALLGAAAALTTNPVLLQLGVVNGRRRRRGLIQETSNDVYPVNRFVKPNKK